MNPNTNAGIVPDFTRRTQIASHEIRSEAINFLRGHKINAAKVEAPENILLRTPDAMQSYLLLSPKYHREPDTVKLVSEARAYIKDRFPICSREAAIAVLLSRDSRETFCKRFELAAMEPEPLPEREEWTIEVEPSMSISPRAQLPIVEGRKFR